MVYWWTVKIGLHDLMLNNKSFLFECSYVYNILPEILHCRVFKASFLKSQICQFIDQISEPAALKDKEILVSGS